MSAQTTSSRICPECGTPNSGFSLFCSECGASMSAATPASVPNDQTTATFRPVTDEEAAPDAYETQTFRVEPATSSQATSTGSAPASPAWASTATSSAATFRGGESRRGLILGWIAAILILLVIGFFAWASILDPDTRDSIIGFFP